MLANFTPMLVATIFTLFIHCVIAEHVPVYIWGASRPLAHVSAVSKLKPDSFEQLLTASISPETKVLLFVEPTLSVEDFLTRDKNGLAIYDRIFRIKDVGEATYAPHVQNAVKTIRQLPNRKWAEISIDSLRSDDQLLYGDNDILLIKLDDFREEEDRAQALERHINDIVSIYHKARGFSKNTMGIFTAHHPSLVLPSDVLLNRKSRAADPPVAQKKTTPVVYQNENILLYVTDVPIFSNNGTRVELRSLDQVTTIDNTNETLIIELENNNKSLAINLVFTFNIGYWYFKQMTVHNETVKMTLANANIFAADRFSYHCNSETFSVNSASNIYVTWKGIQVQPYRNSTDQEHRFGSAFDCVGFTSVAIWSGLLVTFILAAIITVGLIMIMSIKTMDRFDDPKGKTITINASE